MEDVLSVVERVRRSIRQKHNKVKFIGIAGGRGSGKSTVARIIREYFSGTNEVALINIKHFFRDLKPNIKRVYNGHVNMEDPMMIDEVQLMRCLRELQNQRPVTLHMYDMKECRHTDETVVVEPREIVIIHGSYSFYWPHIRDIIKLNIYIDCCGETRLTRLLQNRKDQNPSHVISYFYKYVRPSHQQFVQQQLRHANLIIPWEMDDALKMQIMEIVVQQIENMAGRARAALAPAQ